MILRLFCFFLVFSVLSGKSENIFLYNRVDAVFSGKSDFFPLFLGIDSKYSVFWTVYIQRIFYLFSHIFCYVVIP